MHEWRFFVNSVVESSHRSPAPAKQNRKSVDNGFESGCDDVTTILSDYTVSSRVLRLCYV